MKKVAHILQSKNSGLYFVSSDTSVLEGLKIMLEKNISALLVMDGTTLSGIFTERDYARKIILHGRSSKDTPVSEVMTVDLITVQPDDSIEHCMQIMTNKHIRHLPVVDNAKVAGMISIGDAVKSVIEEQKETIAQLKNYITS